MKPNRAAVKSALDWNPQGMRKRASIEHLEEECRRRNKKKPMKVSRVRVKRSGWPKIEKDGNILPLPCALQQTATGIDDDDDDEEEEEAEEESGGGG